MWFMSSVTQASDIQPSQVAPIIFTLARLDSFMVTIIFSFSNDGVGKAGGHSQRLHHDTFTSFPPTAFSQPIAIIVAFVRDWCLDGITVFTTGYCGTKSWVSWFTHRNHTVEVYLPSIIRLLIAIAWKWCSQYIRTELDANHDYFIAEYGHSKTKGGVLWFYAYGRQTALRKF